MASDDPDLQRGTARTGATGSDALPDAAGAAGEERRFLAAVEEGMVAYLAEQAELLAEISPDAVPLVDAVRSLSLGGKRLRALFAYWGWRAAGGAQDAPEIVRAGIALELFQTAALVHDDIIDRSATRRGQPAVHKRFEALHRDRGWDQDAAHFGVMGGVVAGDLCLSFSEAVFSSVGPQAAAGARGRRIFDLMRTEVMAGQYLDGLGEVLGREDPETALARAETVIRYKSAKYSCEHPLVLGAALAGGSEELLDRLADIGLPLGEAFQLRDDVLGVFGEPSTTGKPAGDDLREGKRTVLVALAHRGADAGQAAEIEAALGDPDLDEDRVRRICAIIRETGALAEVEESIAATEQRVLAGLADLDAPATVRGALETMAARALQRSS